jgi:hypothetical protein
VASVQIEGGALDLLGVDSAKYGKLMKYANIKAE